MIIGDKTIPFLMLHLSVEESDMMKGMIKEIDRKVSDGDCGGSYCVACKADHRSGCRYIEAAAIMRWLLKQNDIRMDLEGEE